MLFESLTKRKLSQTFQADYLPPEIKLMLDLENLIETNFKVDRSPQFYSKSLGITPERLNKLTQFYYSNTVYTLLTDRLYHEAVVLLEQTTMSVKEISMELGICDPSYFGHCFKKYTGLRPKEYRKRFKVHSENSKEKA